MDTKYDQKFEEMKKYIPFLESMIKRLESTSPSATNPRQAQLDKIRSLRDLLLNKKKRMKMENLLKCEQVLINLYAKVEQRDKKAPDPGFAIDPPTPQEKSDLEAVRNKLKTVAKRQEEVQETLPEILRVNEVEEVHTAGSKEPALFQRRPNKASLSPTHKSPKQTTDERVSPQSSVSKRFYTRVLVSPESKGRRWSTTSEAAEEKPLFSRRSPSRRSPRRYSPSYHKKERKKITKEQFSRKSKDLNITLNVPEDSLSSLNTKDIFTRIINCKDGDVDIDTLRELRKQILTELKKTGARDDISDLILKSYNKKRKSKRKEEVEEVEEGELSDSESEVIENVYGNLCGNLVLKDHNETKTSTDKDKARKIQICLVLNSEKDKTDSNTDKNVELPKTSDFLELEMCVEERNEENKVESYKEENKPKVINIDDKDTKISNSTNATKREDISTNKKAIENDEFDIESQQLPEKYNVDKPSKESSQFKANFYKDLVDNSESVQTNILEKNKEVVPTQNQKESDSETETKISTSNANVCNIEAALEKMETLTEIPLLHEPTIAEKPANSTVSEIDILQALKNEILSESITIPGSETSTPLMHQPKIVKVASAKEILPKKRISIEKYKQKAVNSTKLFIDENDSPKEDLIKKPSLKLTDKECERFNFPKISFDDDSSDADDSEIQACDVYSDLAPKSPDHDDSSNIESTPPVIIPADPVKTVQVNKADIDMRTLPILSPNKNKAPLQVPSSNEITVDVMKTDTKADQNKIRNKSSLLDPRVRRDLNSKTSNQSPSPHTAPDRTPRPVFSNINQSPASNPAMTPNTRSFEMTPNHQSFEIDQSSKHVYVPTFSMFDSRESHHSMIKDSREKTDPLMERKPRFDDIGDTSSWSSSDVSFNGEKHKGQRNDKHSFDNRDSFLNKKTECPRTPLPSFGRSDVPVTSSQTFTRIDKPMTPVHPFGRADCPNTPSHPFGRLECPPTASHSFGRLESPSTPSHTFGRSECPPTPSHPFGRSDCPSTPNHSFGSHTFGVTECPPHFQTPNHPFGLLEAGQTPNHPFGRSDAKPNMFGRTDYNTQKYAKDPRLNRKTEYELNSHFDERDRGYYKDHGYYHRSSFKSQKPFSATDSYQNQDREQDRKSKDYYAQDQSRRQLNKDQPRRDQSISGTLYKDYEKYRSLNRDHGRYNSDTRGYNEIATKRVNQRERSIGRTVYPEDTRERSVGRNVHSEDNFARSPPRAPSVGRNSSMELENNTLSVKSQVGRSFTIDTSVNATFQNFLKSGKGLQVFEYNFDARRQRAASVGRSLVRESSVGRILCEGSKQKTESGMKREVFRRASSVGRDMVDSATEKRSFQEIKADFKTYRLPVKEWGTFDTGKIRNIDTKSKNTTENIWRSKKELHNKYKEEKRAQNTSRPVHSSKVMNYRNPRQRKEDAKKNYYDKYGGDYGARNSGIVYSNDNIVKGAILVSGYGVKNYKIPKIKRVIEVKEIESPKKGESVKVNDEEKDKRKNTENRKAEAVYEKASNKSKDKFNGTPKQKNKEAFKETTKEKGKEKLKEIIEEKDTKSETDTETEKHLIQIDDNSKSDEQIERRLTRSSRRILPESKTKIDIVKKNKKTKKSIISDSDSETENELSKDDETVLGITTPELTTSAKENKLKNPSDVDIDTSFGLEELEMFADNVASDPVLDNINELIADLDNDLDTAKNESSDNFTKEILLENMMQNITSPPEDNLIQSGEEFSNVLKTVNDCSKIPAEKMHDISLSALNKEKEIQDNIALVNTQVPQDSNASQYSDNLLCNMKSLEGVSKQKVENDAEENEKNENLGSNKSLSNLIKEDIVSTTEPGKDIALIEDKSKIDGKNMDGCSTPDSTINTDEVSEKTKGNEAVADSTNEVHSETNVTSTDSVEPKPSSLHAETAPANELDSLLSILQDKSKIKELLSMLGDQSGDNDKIKKKLEKLSEIVSDDEKEEETEQTGESKSEVSAPTSDKSTDVSQTVDEKLVNTDEKAKITEEKDTQLNKEDEDEEKEENAENFIGEESAEKEETDLQVMKTKYKKKMPAKKSKFARKGKGRFAKKVTSIAEKRVTRATAAVETQQKRKRPRELQKLHEDIKEMFIRDDILSATGIRMCRLAKMVDEKIPTKEDVALPESEPVVVLEKFKSSINKSRDLAIPEKVRKKPGPKPKPKISTDVLPEIEKPLKYKPGPKSKTKNKRESDPYVFETESTGDTHTEKTSDNDSDMSSDSEIGSLTSSKSFGSSEILADIKKKTKRKRRGWQDGVIKPKHKRKKVESKLEPASETLDNQLPTEKQTIIPDMNCFTDRNYCFRKNELYYSCRLCAFSGTDIVHHYKNEHPHVEIPLSRMTPAAAKEAIEQCKEINFQAVSKISSEKYICIFCYQEFSQNNSVLETFFWHVVSMHTGEYKHNCSECVNESRCPFSLDIPPPPKDTKGQLIGYICKKCNFTQLSLENLKTHVIVRHNDEQTAVYTINLAAMSKKALKEFLRRCDLPEPPLVQTSSRPQEISVKSLEKSSDNAESSAYFCESEAAQLKPAKKTSIPATIQSKITFEADDNVSELSDLTSEELRESTIKTERIDSDNAEEILRDEPQSNNVNEMDKAANYQPIQTSDIEKPHSSPNSGLEDMTSQVSNDIIDYPHFKIYITESGAKEYICCINGKDNHFKTTLLISMKKHVQLKHSENWDGYCFICKVIVTPQGAHRFKDCFQHYLDKHMDNFPIFQMPQSTPEEVPDKQITIKENLAPPKPYIHVRPIYELISSAANITPKENPSFPIIQSVMSLGAQSVEPPGPNPTYPTIRQEKTPSEVTFKYEEVQAKVMFNKHRVVLETMMARDKLVKVYKCAGRFCSFTSDLAEDSLLHASTHERIGGVDALNCSYCDFDSMGNAIDLVMHVFKAHGHCQYSCGQCFYRAAASQSVGAHMARVHGTVQSGAKVLRTTIVTTNTSVEATMMTREQAVSYYVCNHVESSGACKFRTYTPDKFCEHLQQRHGAAPSHPCYMCSTEEKSPSELVQHMKSHGLKLYQCTWCIHGADNEAELLTHVSMVHPAKQPQAYLRIITNKEGSNELRVLPLAFLHNKLKVPTEDVTPNTTKENPVREAERSIDLEKLISLTMIMEPMNEPETASVDTNPLMDLISNPSADLIADPPVDLISDPAVDLITDPSQQAVAAINPSTQLETEVVAPITNSVAASSRQTEIEQVTDSQPIVEPAMVTATVEPPKSVTESIPVKAEPVETPKTQASDIVVIDSDEEETKQSVIDLSDEDRSTSSRKSDLNQKVSLDILATCPKCRQICKSMNGLKKHLYYCYPNKEEGSRCAHCPYLASNRDNIMQHYTDDHCDRNVYQCGMCRVKLSSVNLVKRHVKYFHKEKDLTVSSTFENGNFCYTVTVSHKKEKKEVPKRKLSATYVPNNTTPELVHNKRRFSPEDIEQLPQQAVFEHLTYCEICEFSTKVRANMVRHLQLHATQERVPPPSAPLNPVPHLETNEKHFDKMVNLASSSVMNRAPEKTRPSKPSFVAVQMSRELAARYPKQISARQRNTCGAIGCLYTSVDEPMLKRHWEALHSGPASFNFRCVHCPNNQITDTSKPITASRVVAHLKMHDDTLYACSKCNFYHFKRDFLEKHLTEVHPTGQLMIVRENAGTSDALAPATQGGATAMDMQLWQCGLCKFKCMLRAEIVDHCSKLHQSKMQYRCTYCPYRASVIENVHNHLAHSHANEPKDLIHYYYQEGSIHDDENGTPRWMVQRQKLGSAEPEIKTEAEGTPDPASTVSAPVNINLELVKKEVEDVAVPEVVATMEELCTKFGEFCEPNGIKYKCPLCKVIIEDTREAMQSHLYEELKYRKWGCGRCNYKAFHKTGLTEHMAAEHFRQYAHIELPTNGNIEKWVAGQLDHQAAIIDKYKTNLAQQKIIVERSKPAPSTVAPATIVPADKYPVAQLEQAFGEFGAPSNVMYSCPKCGTLNNDEAAMRDHLEMELNKIRWGCTICSAKYHTFHEAQFHCKEHDTPSMPKEASRDPSMRAAWVTNVIMTQKKLLQGVSLTPTSTEPTERNVPENDNSLLVVRYEERVSTPDLVPIRRKRSAQDSDEERLIIDEGSAKKKGVRSCPFCNFTCKNYNSWKEHITMKHSTTKLYICSYCNVGSNYRKDIVNHTEKVHPNQPARIRITALEKNSNTVSPKKRVAEVDLVCLFCEKPIPETETDAHLHENVKPDFAKKGDVVVKCCICLSLHLDVNALQDHHNVAHPDLPINYALYKLLHENRETHYCGYCENVGFKFLRDLRTHHNAAHPFKLFKYTTVPYCNEESQKDFPTQSLPKRCARKSTTKLPGCKSIAKKSTTKLPYSVPGTSKDGYSYYKTKPEPLENYSNVTTLMSFCNTMMPFTLKKLSEIINIEPQVIVKDIEIEEKTKKNQ